MGKKERRYKEYIIKIVSIILFISVILSLYKYFSRYFYLLKSPKKIYDAIEITGYYGIVIYIFIEICQVVFFFIPGDIIEIIGGYIFGKFLGTIISVLGIFLGSVIAYWISRTLGRNYIRKIIEKRNLKLFKKTLEKSNNKLGLLLIFLIPGVPKDFIVYMCGISNISFKNFLIYSTLGRFPGLLLTTTFGSCIYKKNYTQLIIVSIIGVIFLMIGLLKGKSIIKYINEKQPS